MDADRKAFAERRAEANRYFTSLWGEGTSRGVLSLFTIPADRPFHLSSKDLGSAAHEAVQASLGGENTYASACLMDPFICSQAGKRGGAEHASVITGVWSDLDVAGPAHASNDLPPTAAKWLDILDSLEFPPTMAVDTGHGIQVYWLFVVARTLEDDDARERARQLVEGAQNAIRARSNGWTVDPTADLARLLRIPGTTNWKIPDEPVPVRILFDDGPRYEPKVLVDAWAGLARPRSESAPPFAQHITAGGRTHAITSLAGMHRRRDVPEELVQSWAQDFNRLICEPPLSEHKVRETVHGIYGRYPADGPPLTNGKASTLRRGLLRPFSEITPIPMRFIWRPRIYQGYLTLLAGDPGMGKGLIAAALVGAITAGTAVPEGTVPSGSVLWVSYEESEASAIRPRLDVAGADPEKVFQFVMPQDDGSEDKRFRPADVSLLRELLASHPDIRLIVLDPIISYFGGDRDINQSNQVRDVLEPLTNMADAMGTGVLGIAHINKSELSKTLYRISNSGAFVQVARSVLGVGELKDGRRGLAHIKSSYSKRAAVIPYDTIGVPYPGFEETVGRVIWDAPDPEIDPLQIFESKTQQKNRGPTRAEECGKAVLALLADGPKFTTDIRMALRRQGFSDDAIDGGRDWAGVIRSGRGDKGRWYPPSRDTHPELSTTESEVDLTESGAQLGGCVSEDPFDALPGEGDL